MIIIKRHFRTIKIGMILKVNFYLRRNAQITFDWLMSFWHFCAMSVKLLLYLEVQILANILRRILCCVIAKNNHLFWQCMSHQIILLIIFQIRDVIWESDSDRIKSRDGNYVYPTLKNNVLEEDKRWQIPRHKSSLFYRFNFPAR